MPDEQEQLVGQILAFLEAGNVSDLGRLLTEQRPSDIAEVTELLDNEQRRTIRAARRR